ncbi:MAG: amidohydrolase family protein [Alphaproteobacteria bacterium]
MNDMVIDLHAHTVFEEGFGQAGKYGPELAKDEQGVPYFRFGGYQMKPMDYTGTIFMDANKRLEAMDAHGADMQMLSANPLTWFHHIDAADAIHFCKVQNDAMAKLCSDHPDKFLGSASLPMQDVDAAMEELNRCVKELGMVGAYVGTNYPYDLDDARLDDFYRLLVDLDVPLFFHPASTGGVTGPDDPRMARFDMTLLLGYPYEETMAIAQLIFGGVLDRHPDLDICMSHGGGAIAFLLPRFEGMSKFRDWAPDSVKEHGFQAVLKRMWFDAHVNGEAPHQMLIDVVGEDRLVYGTNFGGWDTPPKADAFAASLGRNARKLLRLDK